MGRAKWLHKKSGGKEGDAKLKLFQKWDERYFVLQPGGTVLTYHKSKADSEALGCVQCLGANVFLKGVTKDMEYRFTVATKERELKLRAKNKSEYEAWMAALKPVVSDFVDDQDEED